MWCGVETLIPHLVGLELDYHLPRRMDGSCPLTLACVARGCRRTWASVCLFGTGCSREQSCCPVALAWCAGRVVAVSIGNEHPVFTSPAVLASFTNPPFSSPGISTQRIRLPHSSSNAKAALQNRSIKPSSVEITSLVLPRHSPHACQTRSLACGSRYYPVCVRRMLLRDSALR